MALLSTSIPLAMTLTATLVAVDSNGALVVKPSAEQIKQASSIHVLAFSSYGDLLVIESEGDFTLDTLDEVQQKARLVCYGEERDESESGSEDVSMGMDDVPTLANVIKEAVEGKVAEEQRWKRNVG